MGTMATGVATAEFVARGTGTPRDAKSYEDVVTALETLARERILILDGAMGTMIQRHKLSEAISAASDLPIGTCRSKATTTCWS